MIGIDPFCSSQAATSIRLTSINDHVSSSSSTVHLGSSRLIDRHNPIITDPSRQEQRHGANKECETSQLSSNLIVAQKVILSPKADAASHNAKSSPSVSKQAPENENTTKKSKKKNENKNKNKNTDFVSRISCVKGSGFISPSGSTRYLLGERTSLLDVVKGSEPVVSIVPGQQATENMNKTEPGKKLMESEITKKLDVEAGPLSKMAFSSRSSDQVVVLRVSLHCKGCAGKVKKYISKMQGVTSFNVDFAAKKVTVVGDVTPLEVLTSISKVKTAKLWTPPKSSAQPSTTTNTYSGMNKENSSYMNGVAQK